MTTKGTDNRFRSLTVVGESGTPATPASGDFKLYVADDGTLFLMDDTGATVDLTASGFSDPMTSRGDIIVRNTSNVTARLAKGSADTFLHSDGTDVGYAAVTDAMLSTSDITTNNASTSKHGFAPKYPNDATKYLDGTGAYSVPSGAGGTSLLGINIYAASATLTQTSATMADADATNMKVTFTAPGSGNVLVRLTGSWRMASGASAGDRVKWGLRESTTDIATGQFVGYIQATLGSNIIQATSCAFYLTGVSAGSHTYKWSIGAGGAASGGVFVDSSNPAVMEVWG